MVDLYSNVLVTDDDIKREKHQARELRRSKWWRRKCSQSICYYCNKRFPPNKLTMDHLIPISKGGKSIKSNIVTACKECNNKKKYLLPIEWEEYMENLTKDQKYRGDYYAM